MLYTSICFFHSIILILSLIGAKLQSSSSSSLYATAFISPQTQIIATTSGTTATQRRNCDYINTNGVGTSSKTQLFEMERPILDRIASGLFRLEMDRVKKSSEIDDNGRDGEPMEWSESTSLANTFSEIMATYGYSFKQFVADIVAGNEYDTEVTKDTIQQFIASDTVTMFSFTTCPFCRRAKDVLDDAKISYKALELDELPGNEGNEIRAQLGKLTRRTSVPCIFVNEECIGGCNDGTPGLLPLLESGELAQ